VKNVFPQQDWKWLLGELPSHLEPIAALRNPAAHSARLNRLDAAEIRAQVLGIGCEGLIVAIGRVRMRATA
jgi:hypothetical protein